VNPATAPAVEALAPWRDRFLHEVRHLTAPVAVGCSGGADSVALLALAVDAGLEPVAVHVDHGLRAGSEREADAVAAVAATLGAGFHARRAPVAGGPNLEARARVGRYDALERARVTLGAEVVLVGHTADDQAETVLLNVLRGSAGAGLAGMSPRRERVVRPLLGMRRAETHAICDALAFAVLDDPMNHDVEFRRVAIRREVLPMLSSLAARDLVPVLARQADILRSESEFLDALAVASWPDDDPPTVVALEALPLVLARRAVRIWLGAPPPSSSEVDRVLAVASGASRGTQLAGGRAVRRSAGRLSITRT
jgi:tRNA(Ile)-lysidine synthase